MEAGFPTTVEVLMSMSDRDGRRIDPPQATLAGVTIGGKAPVKVMGVLNVSPESFYEGSVRHEQDLVRTGVEMVHAGAVLIDVGARSTAPYLATAIDEDEERRRLARAVDLLAAKLDVPISADTARPGPARAAFEAGARVLNDVSGLRDPQVAALARAHDVGIVLMAHPDGRPAASQAGPRPIEVIRAILDDALARVRRAGIADDRVVLDPGIGFFRDESTAWHAWDASVLAELAALLALGRPLCVGVSRKSFIGAITGQAAPADRLAGSLAATATAVLHGAALVRTHDVRETVDAVRVAERVRGALRP